VSKKHLFVLQHGSNAMLKGLLNSGELDDPETFPNRDLKQKAILDKLSQRDDNEYRKYRDRRMDAKIDRAESGAAKKVDVALAISTDRHIGHDHLHWVIANGSTAAIGNALMNKHSTRKHFYQAHGIAMANPEKGPAILRHLRNNERTPNDLKEKL
jgi:hypothetical protein